MPRSLQEAILAQVQRIVKGEVSVALKEQQAAVTSSIMQAMRSAAGTPVPAAHLDCQAQQAHILQLLQQGHLNQAFQQVSQALGPGRGQCLLTRPTLPIRLQVVWQQTVLGSLCLQAISLAFPSAWTLDPFISTSVHLALSLPFSEIFPDPLE